MKNTGIEYISIEKTPEINPAFSDLLPPLPDEQYAQLEADILENGCYSPIVVNEDMEIVDGHHRYAICRGRDIPFKMVAFSFESVLEAQRWALATQKARRNLTTWELGQIALKLKPALEEKGKENMAAGGGDKLHSETKAGSAILPNPVDTRKEMAETAGIGERTMGKIMQIDENAPESVKEAMDHGMSVNKGYEITRQVKDLPEEEREEAAKAAIAKEEMEKGQKAVDENVKIARRISAAFEKAILIEVSEHNVRAWIEWAGIRNDEICGMMDEARTIADSFGSIAGILRDIYEKEAMPHEKDEDTGETGDESPSDTGSAKGEAKDIGEAGEG